MRRALHACCAVQQEGQLLPRPSCGAVCLQHWPRTCQPWQWPSLSSSIGEQPSLAPSHTPLTAPFTLPTVPQLEDPGAQGAVRGQDLPPHRAEAEARDDLAAGPGEGGVRGGRVCVCVRVGVGERGVRFSPDNACLPWAGLASREPCNASAPIQQAVCSHPLGPLSPRLPCLPAFPLPRWSCRRLRPPAATQRASRPSRAAPRPAAWLACLACMTWRRWRQQVRAVLCK